MDQRRTCPSVSRNSICSKDPHVTDLSHREALSPHHVVLLPPRDVVHDLHRVTLPLRHHEIHNHHNVTLPLLRHGKEKCHCVTKFR